MTNEQPVVLLEHAQKSFGGTPVLKDISLKVQPGEVGAVIGRTRSWSSWARRARVSRRCCAA